MGLGDIDGVIVPAYALNSILGNIPILGDILQGGEGEGMFSATYKIAGDLAEPKIDVNPWAALAPGFLRGIFTEDIGDGDITSEAVFREPRVGAAEIVAKADGVFCGGEVLRCVYRHVDEQVSVDILANDGDVVGPGDAVARLGGSVKSLLIGERTALTSSSA